MKCFKFLLLAVCIHIGFAVKLTEKFKWKEVQYDWPSDSAKEDAIREGRYKPENNLILGLDVWNDKLFITVPRYLFIYFCIENWCEQKIIEDTRRYFTLYLC